MEGTRTASVKPARDDAREDTDVAAPCFGETEEEEREDEVRTDDEEEDEDDVVTDDALLLTLVPARSPRLPPPVVDVALVLAEEDVAELEELLVTLPPAPTSW